MLLPSDISSKYPRLTTEDIYSSIEIAAIRVAHIMLGKTMQATVDETGLHMYMLGKGDITEVNLRGLKRIIGKPLLEEIESELMQRDALYEAQQYRGLRGAVVTGEILSRTKHGDYNVQVEIMDAGNPILLVAKLPRNQQCQRDYYRGAYNKGSILPFYAYSCQAVKTADRAWMQLTISRTTKDFPCAILRKLTGLPGIRCIERKPGEYSKIITREVIPKSAINTVGKQLREHLDVVCTKQR